MEYVVNTTDSAGKNPSADAAVVSVPGNDLPLLLYEYKPVVDPRPPFVNTKDLLELLVQGFYCLCKRAISRVIHCLTDLYTWHYIELGLNESHGGLVVVWNKTFVYDSSVQQSDVKEHCNFLVYHLSVASSQLLSCLL